MMQNSSFPRQWRVSDLSHHLTRGIRDIRDIRDIWYLWWCVPWTPETENPRRWTYCAFFVSLVRTTRTTQCTLLTQALRNTSTAPPQQSMWLTMAGSFSGCSRAALRTLVGGLGWCVFSSAGAEATKKDVGYRLKHPTSLGVSPSLSQCPATMLEVTSSGPRIYCCAGCVWASLHI